MQNDLLNFMLAFLEGIALIISPCILPILPIILSGSIQGARKRPYGIILGFISIFILFTFFSRRLVLVFGIDLNFVRNVSLGLLVLFAAIMISNYLAEKFELLTARLSNLGANWKIFKQPNQGFISGIIFGGLTGIIWTPCAGPILAAVILQTILQQTNLTSFITLLFFAIGVAIPMLAIAIFGREIVSKLSFLKTNAVLLRKILGYIIILSVIYMIYGTGFVLSFSKVKNNLLTPQTMLLRAINKPYPMPQIEGIAAWINSDPIKREQLNHHVVLVDFWTYSCINCIRILPYLKDWYAKYHDKGLLIVGVHSPEFEFEKNLENVKNAVAKFGIKYPVALDNNFITWRNYNNRYWPAHYLIDKNGIVVYQHFGEGEYDVMENNIRYLLGLQRVESNPTKVANFPQTPETYLGYSRANQFKSPEIVGRNIIKKYSYPESLSVDEWALLGEWRITPEYIVSASADAAIKLHFRATKVYAVFGNSSKQAVAVSIFLNGNLVAKEIIGAANYALHPLIEGKDYFSGMLELVISAPGLEIYTFTFGN